MVEMILNSGLKFRVRGYGLYVSGNAGLLRKWCPLIREWKPAIISSSEGFEGVNGGLELMESISSVQADGDIVAVVGVIEFGFHPSVNLDCLLVSEPEDIATRDEVISMLESSDAVDAVFVSVGSKWYRIYF